MGDGWTQAALCVGLSKPKKKWNNDERSQTCLNYRKQHPGFEQISDAAELSSSLTHIRFNTSVSIHFPSVKALFLTSRSCAWPSLSPHLLRPTPCLYFKQSPSFWQGTRDALAEAYWICLLICPALSFMFATLLLRNRAHSTPTNHAAN